ncbi:MAG: pyridoxamine 5'-phosphate oxidase family protein [Acidimicrobiales bacterium]
MPSRREQIRMTPEEVEAFLTSRTSGVLGTVDATGAPHLVHMGYLYRDGELVFSSFAKAQKVVNLRRCPRASFLVEIPSPYHEIRGVLLRGDVTLSEDYDVVLRAMQEVQAAAEAASTDPLPPIDLPDVARKRVICRLKPDHIASWDHSRLGGVY